MQLKVRVFMNEVSFHNNNARPIMERFIDWNDSIKFPYEDVFKANKALYGASSITIFELM